MNVNNNYKKCQNKNLRTMLSFCFGLVTTTPIKNIIIVVIKVFKNKNLKIMIIDHFFPCDLMVMKLCTVIEPGNTERKLKLKFLERSSFPW